MGAPELSLWRRFTQINPAIPPPPPDDIQLQQINPAIPPPPPPAEPQTSTAIASPQPIQTPQDASQQQIGFVVIAIVGFLLLLSFHKRRENARHNFRYMLLAGMIAIVALFFANSDPAYQGAAWVIALLVAVAVFAMRPPRKRRIPQSVRRKAIARYERKTGKKFDRRKQELDHIVPFSKGGSHTIDNLRVMEKSENRSKGARTPWWDIFGLWQ